MAKLGNTHIAKKKNTATSIVKLKVVVEKLQKTLLLHLGHKPSPSVNEVPSDVKEGHFAVIAVEHDQEKRFVVPLSYLAYPFFLRLLEQAAEEYGFDHKGTLMIPCRPIQLQRMLAEQCAKKEGEKDSPVLHSEWDSHTLVETC